MIFIASSINQNPIQKANMIFLSKEATNKDQSPKMQMMLSLDKESASNSEKIWKKKFFEGDQKGDFTITKPNFLENTLVYCNQSTISTLKARDYAIYLDYIILGQIIPAFNSPADLDNYILKENKVILHVSLYNTETGHFRRVKKWLVFVMIRGDSHEDFYSYGYDEEKSRVLYSSLKHPLANILQGTAFKKHVEKLIEEKQNKESSKLFFFLPSTTDRKEKINKFLEMLTFIRLILLTKILLTIQLKVRLFFLII